MSKKENEFMIWSSNFDVNDYKEDLKFALKEGYIGNREEEIEKASINAWELHEGENQEKYDNMLYKDYRQKKIEFIKNFIEKAEASITDEEVDKFIDSNYDEAYDYVAELNNTYLENDKEQLNIFTEGTILCIEACERWSGIVYGVEEVKGNNISDCLQSRIRSNEGMDFYVNKETMELCQREYHHDGTNCYVYREVKDTATEQDIDEFLDKVRSGSFTQEDLDKVTKSMGEYIQKVYGFEVEKPKVKEDLTVEEK